eukprot:6176922-Amphidinium_carterae.1
MPRYLAFKSFHFQQRSKCLGPARQRALSRMKGFQAAITAATQQTMSMMSETPTVNTRQVGQTEQRTSALFGASQSEKYGSERPSVISQRPSVLGATQDEKGQQTKSHCARKHCQARFFSNAYT